MTARILDITAAEYHALPNFSASIAKTVISQSPRHAREQRGKAPTKEMERGDVIHRLVLGAGKDFEVVNADSWRTNAAKADRDRARDAGKTPILVEQFEGACLAAEHIRTGLAERGIHLDGKSEASVIWTDEGVECKSRFDHMWPPGESEAEVLDLKIPESAAPLTIERTAENLGYAIQAAAYTRAYGKIMPSMVGRTRFLFAFCEPNPPYAMAVLAPDGMFRELGEQRWVRALRLWKRCLEADKWPAYEEYQTIGAPQWALRQEGFASDE